jgi:hypothetical protein
MLSLCLTRTLHGVTYLLEYGTSGMILLIVLLGYYLVLYDFKFEASQQWRRSTCTWSTDCTMAIMPPDDDEASYHCSTSHAVLLSFLGVVT